MFPKKFIRIFAPSFLVLVFCAVSFAQEKSSKSEREVLAVVNQWADAVVKRDMDALDRIFSADLIVTTYDGATRGKAEELRILKPSAEVKTISVKNEDLRVKIYNKTAIVTAITKMQFSINGKDAQTAFRYTAVFVKQNGRWQIVALQTARIAQPKTN